MEKIYWLQRLGNINTLMWVVFAISFMVCVIILITRLIIGNNVCFDGEKKFVSSYGKIVKTTTIITICSLSLAIFIPTTKEAYEIYGIGGTIDYLKENETAKQLPDKVINALDKWVDNIAKEDEKKKH